MSTLSERIFQRTNRLVAAAGKNINYQGKDTGNYVARHVPAQGFYVVGMLPDRTAVVLNKEGFEFSVNQAGVASHEDSATQWKYLQIVGTLEELVLPKRTKSNN